MEAVIENELLTSFNAAWNPPWTGSIYEWAHRNVELPNAYAVQGRFDISISKYLIPPLDDLLNNKVVQVNIIAATQTGKTMGSEIFIPYIICNDPGPVLKLHQSEEMAGLFAETRLIPLLQNCKPVKAMLDYNRFSAKKKGILLPHMAATIGGAKENLLHGVSIRYLMLDECHLYDKEVIVKAKSRTTAFSHNKKILLTSQPGIEKDQLSEQNTGLDYQWGWKCPSCTILQPYYWTKEKQDGTWAGFNWIKTYTSGSLDEYDYEATGASTKLNCYYCTASVSDTPVEREYLNSTGEYILIKDNGDHSVHTYRWPAFVNKGISFKEKTIQYLLARAAHKQTGNLDALQIFTQQVLGQEWKRTTVYDAAKVLISSFNPSDLWKEEIFRCMAVDYQKKYATKFFVVTAWSKTECRVLEHGLVLTWDEVEVIQKKWKIPAPGVFVDSGFNSDEVYKQCCAHIQPIKIGKRIEAYGWYALKGDGQHNDYPHKDGTRRYYSQETKIAINNIQFARLHLWSNFAIKTSLVWIRDGKSDIKMVMPAIDPEFERHMHSETLEEVIDAKTGLKIKRWIKRHDDNHFFDCMSMCILAANMRGIFLIPIKDHTYIISDSTPSSSNDDKKEE